MGFVPFDAAKVRHLGTPAIGRQGFHPKKAVFLIKINCVCAHNMFLSMF